MLASSHLRRNTKLLLAVVLALILLAVQILNFTGFCYSEFKYLSKQELIDRLLFQDQANFLTFEQKKAAMDQRGGGEYPYAYWVSGASASASPLIDMINKILGMYYFEVSSVSKTHVSTYEVNACGTKSIFKYSEENTTDAYDKFIADEKSQTTNN